MDYERLPDHLTASELVLWRNADDFSNSDYAPSEIRALLQTVGKERERANQERKLANEWLVEKEAALQEIKSLTRRRDFLRRSLEECVSDTKCRCDVAYTSRGRHESNSHCQLSEDMAKVLAQEGDI